MKKAEYSQGPGDDDANDAEDDVDGAQGLLRGWLCLFTAPPIQLHTLEKELSPVDTLWLVV